MNRHWEGVTRHHFRLVAACLALLVVVGCAPFGQSETAAPGFAADEFFDSGEMPEASGGAVPPQEGGLQAAPTARALPADVPATGESQAPEPSERLRVFSGDLTLSVPRVEETRLNIIELAEQAGGYVERSAEDLVVIRVPAAEFDEVMETLEALGEIEFRSVQTADVTDQFTDLERRLQIATGARDRLYELLERAQDAEERVAILREIRRLTEEVERLRSALDSLAELVRFSRITVRLQSRIDADQVLRDRIPFAWIARLDPLTATVGEAGRALGLTVPDGFAAFAERESIRAEAADGARLRVGARVNRPAGDAAFWSQAVGFHLEPFYRSMEPFQSGHYQGVLLESKDRDPFFYLIAMVEDGDQLIVAEAFFPDITSLERHLDAVRGMLAGGGEE